MKYKRSTSLPLLGTPNNFYQQLFCVFIGTEIVFSFNLKKAVYCVLVTSVVCRISVIGYAVYAERKLQ